MAASTQSETTPELSTESTAEPGEESSESTSSTVTRESVQIDLYAAYLHGASQWDGDYAPVAENGVAVYIYMAEGDEYYGSDKARSAYENLQG